MFKTLYYGPSMGVLIDNFTEEKVKFEKWNTTSVQFLIIAIIETRDSINHFNFVLECFDKFIAWRRTQPPDYIPSTGLESMYSVEELYQIREFFRENMPKGDETEEEKDAFRKVYDMFYIELRKKYPSPRMITLDGINESMRELSETEKFIKWSNEHPYKSSGILFGIPYIAGILTGVGGILMYQKLRK